MSTSARTITTAALTELALISAEETPDSNNLAQALLVLNRLISVWRTRRQYVWAIVANSFAWTTSQSSYTIGPTGNFAMTVRPPKIERANLIRVENTPDDRIPLAVIEVSDYSEIPNYLDTAEEPTAIYYQPSVPNGTIWPYPYPENTSVALAKKLEVFTWQILSSFATLDTGVDLPDGYEDALTLNLAKRLASGYGVSISPELEQSRLEATRAIQSLNSGSPKLASDAPGPASSGPVYYRLPQS